MKKRSNIVFYNICFLASILAEIYCFTRQGADLNLMIGAGLFVLLTGYLLMCSIRKKWISRREEMKSVFRQLSGEEIQKWDTRYKELTDLHKATYGAYKKSNAMMEEKFNLILDKLETIEKDNAQSLQKIIELQKRSMEGQRKALNYEVNYNKENAIQIIKAIKDMKEMALSPETGTKKAQKEKTVVPLYDDPNKELTTEEIAQLFSSYGK